MAACCIFDEDEVCIPTSSGGFKYGLVVESSECVSSDDEDDPDESRVQKGQVKVTWYPSGTETVVAEDKVILTNRSLMPGDVVRRLITGEQSQRGYVQSVHTKCHVKVLGSKQYIYNIDAADIKPMQEFDPEPEVTLDSWVGQIVDVVEEITVRFPCGARCILENVGALNLEDIHDNRESHSEFAIRHFYPGQELAGSYDDYEDATWLYTSNVRGPKSKIKSLYKATVKVEEVKTHSITVDWACKGFTRAGAGTDKLESPPDVVQGDDLKRVRRLDCFEYCHSQIGDKGFYTVKEDDIILHNISPRKYITPDVLELQAKDMVTVLGTSADGIIVEQKCASNRKTQSANSNENTDLPEHQTNTETGNETGAKTANASEGTGDVNKHSADVITDDDFQDIEDEESDSDSDSASLPSGAGSPARNRKVRKRPGYGIPRLVGKKARKKVRRNELDVKPGLRVPVEIAYTFSSCDVMWQNGTIEPKVPSTELFPIHHLDELEFFPGDFVLDDKKTTSTDYGVIVSSDHKERTVMVKWIQPGKSTKPIEQDPVELSVFDIKDHPDYKFRCGCTVIRVGGYEGDTDVEAVGQVHSINGDGVISVWWPDRTITSCYPQDLYIIGEEFRSESGSESEEWTDVEEEEEGEESDVSWETENEETDEDNETNSPLGKKIPSFSETKLIEFGALLVRAESSICRLLTVFENTAVPYFNNAELVFHDILALFKRCKELDKVLKSSFFNDDEIAALIASLKSELRKEKTVKLSKHVVSIYKNRTLGNDNPIPENNNESVEGLPESWKPLEENNVELDTGVNCNTDTAVANNVQGAEGGMPIKSLYGNVNLATKEEKELVDKINSSSTDDSLLEIILDGLIAQDSKLDSFNNSTIPSAMGDCIKGIQTGTLDELIKNDYMQTVISALCTTDNQKPELQNAETKSQVDINESPIENGGFEKSEKKKKNSEEPKMPQNHRTLCINLCKAFNVRVMQMKQKMYKSWLAKELGCEENVSDAEIMEKMREKMAQTMTVPEGINDVIGVNRDKVHGTEGIEELESLEKRRDSCESDTLDQSMTELPEPAATDGDIEEKGFEVCAEAPNCHKFKYQEKKLTNPKSFMNAVRKEWNLLRTSLPDGIFVKVFEDRMDLMSVMIMGPIQTPYEDGLFVFDIQLPGDYPDSPPAFHYLSFCNERLNPNLYEDGKVCVSLLGTWSGKGNECWTNKSSVLQVLVSIQGLILVPEPYFNEAGYEKQRGSQHGQENSRMYNEMAVLKLVQSMAKMSVTPPSIFVEETRTHILHHAQRFVDRVEHWVKLSDGSRLVPNMNEESYPTLCNGNQSGNSETHQEEPVKNDIQRCEPVNEHGVSADCTKVDAYISKSVVNKNSLDPEFPLLPASKGFCLTVRKHLDCLKEVLREHVFINSQSQAS